jgi:hypothetical protein
MRLKRLGYLVLALVFALGGWTSGAHAQGQTTGSIRGEVNSTAGAPVPSARVMAVNTETGFRRAVVTDAAGRYSIPLLPPGTYRVEVQGVGFAPFVAQEVNVRLGEASPLNPRLGEQAIALEGITVSGERARIDPTQGGVRQTVTPEQVETLPTQGRDFTDLINLSPLVSPQPGTGTGGQFSIGGARSSGTNVQVDGVDANNVFFGENRGSSRTPFAFSLESIKELQLITNGFDVEYGNYVGGVVNAVTKGGTNEFRGGAFGFFRDEALTAQDFNGQAPEDFRSYQFGANASGPIVRDKVHFFVSADAQLKDQPVFAVTPEASGIPAGTISQFISLLEQKGVADAGRFFGPAEQAEDNLVLFGRIDWQVGSNNRLTLRQNFSDFEQTNDRLSSRGEEALTHAGPFRNRVWSTVAELNSVFGADAFNIFRLQWSTEDRPRDPNELGFLPEIEVNVGGGEIIEFGGDGIIFRNRLEENKLQLVDNFTYQRGAHTFKVGTNNSLSTTRNTFFLLGNGEFKFNSLEAFARGEPSSFFRFVRACPDQLQPNQAGQPVICNNLDVPFAEFDALEWSVYAQDDWQVTDRLLVTPGLRYGGTNFLDDPAGVPQIESAFRDPLTEQAVRTGFLPSFAGLSPRLAFTYDVSGNERNVLRGGAGLLVGRAPGVLVGNVFQTERPLLSVFCTGSSIPAFNLPELLAGQRGANNPSACAGGQAPRGRPDFTFFSDDFELPRTFKANLGYEQLLGTETKVGIDLIYSRTWNNFSVRDLNLRQPAFQLADGRPVFVPQNRFNPARRAGAERLGNDAFNRVFLNVTEAEAEAFNVALELDQPVGDALQFGVRYALNFAFDNSSFSCCISQEGLEVPTAGDPNFIGDLGDDERGTFGPSDFERRHTFVANFLYRAPFGILASGIWRLQSGTPFTPIVQGDINGDALDENDRAFISPDLQFATAQDRALLQQKLDEFDCLAEQVGTIAGRNTCRNPWFNSLDMRLAKEFQTFRRQRFEVLLDLFNVLNGLNEDWGRFTAVLGDDQELLVARRFDRNTGNVVFAVNPEFGTETPVGFDPFQFQAQLGIRYRF